MIKNSYFAPIAAILLCTLPLTAIIAETGWDTLHVRLMQQGKASIRAAGIYGQDGSTWYASSELRANAEEVKKLVAGLRDPSKLKAGITFNGTKFMFLQVSGDVAHGKKGPNYIYLQLSKKGIVVAVLKEGVRPPAAVKAMDFVVAELLKKGF